MDSGVQLMHAGEEALFVLIPLAVVLYLDHRQRRKDKQRIEEIKRQGSEGDERAAHPGDG